MDDLLENAPSLTHRIVLLAVASLDQDGDTPAHSGAVRSTSIDLLAAVDDDPLGNLAESDTMRTLNELEAAGVVTATDLTETSPVGKGRPGYELAVDADAVLDVMTADDRVSEFATRVRQDAQ